MRSEIRLSFTLSGGASLGAYQSGAMAAVLVAVQTLDEWGELGIRIDTLGGASSGALVAFFAAHALADGLDPVGLLRTTWVERVSLDLLRSRHGRAPLDFEDMRNGLRGVLGADGTEPDHPRTRPVPNEPVTLYVSLTGLQGLTYPIRSAVQDRDLIGTTYADWGRFRLEPGGGPERLFEPEGRSPLDFVLASASNPGAFAPRLLDRIPDTEAYRERGIENFPEHGRLWYSDGSLVQAEPIGRVLAATRGVDGVPEEGVRRVHVVVHPRSEGPSGSGRWSDPDDVPRWEEGLSRALAILPAQVLYDDLRRVEKRNSRLEWSAWLVEALEPHLGEGTEAAVDRVLERVDDERERVRSDAREEGGRDRYPDETAAVRKLRRAVEEVGGLATKERVPVEVISPRLLSEELGEDVPALLAGEFLGEFGGFMRRELRESDFRLGYASGRLWLERAVDEIDMDEAVVHALMERVDEESPGDWREANRGDAGIRSLPWRARLRLARYVLHVGRVVAAALLGR